MSWLQSGMFSRASLAVIPIPNNNPRDALLLVVSSSSRDGIKFTSSEVLDLVCLTVGRVDCANQHVVRDIIQVATVFKPRAGH